MMAVAAAVVLAMVMLMSTKLSEHTESKRPERE